MVHNPRDQHETVDELLGGIAPEAVTEAAEHVEGEPEPTLLEQMGGITGLVSSTLPVLVLVPVNAAWGLTPALLAAVVVAIAIFVWRLVRKESLQPAISGLFGVAICAAIAWVVGDAKGYFLYGIWVSLVFAIAAVISVVVRWPAVGLIWNGINGHGTGWQKHPAARRCYVWATLGWAVVFLARFAVQNYFYDGDSTTALAVARVLMGWPLTGLVTLLTIVLVRRANAILAAEHPEDPDHDATSTSESEAQ